MDTLCERNAFGRQIRSFEEDLEIPGHRRRAGARRLHPRAVAGRVRRRGRDPGRGRRPPRRRAPGQHARDLVPPGDRGRDRACTSCSCGTSRVIVYFTRHGESVANVADRDDAGRAPTTPTACPSAAGSRRAGVGERLRGEGIEAIIASARTAARRRPRRRSARCSACRSRPTRTCTRCASPTPTRAASPRLRGHRPRSRGCRAPAPDHAEPGAESFDDILARVAACRSGSRRALTTSACCASRTGASCTSSSARAIFREEFAPRHLPGAVPDLARQHRHHDLRAPPRTT